MARPTDAYRPRRPGESVLYRIVREHLETFRAQSASLRGGEGLPRFVEEEFRAYLRCGWLAAGFARFRCAACGTDRLVAFSCKGRGFCPSCGARRMTALTAHLTDQVFPAVPVRQWVLSLPHRVRYLLAWDHDLCRAVVAVLLGAVMGFLRDRAGERGIRGGRSGAVAVVQRFGAALNLNVHVHALVLDGVFSLDAAGALVFHEAEPPSDEEVGRVLEIVALRVERLLDRRGHGVDEDGFAPDRWAEEAPALASMAAAAVLGRAATGPRAGARIRRGADGRDDGEAEPARAPCRHAHHRGFDLHAGILAPAGHTRRLERLCRYALRPPVAEERVQVTPDRQVVLRLRHRWTDGTTHVVFEPTEFLERLAVITPRPRINLVLYYGLLAPRSSWRDAVVRDGGRRSDPTAQRTSGGAAGASDPGTASWAALMRRAFGFDVLACPRCGHAMRLIALIEQPEVIRRILRHLGHPLDVPPPAPARVPPFAGDADDASSAHGLPFADEAEWTPTEEEPC